ncbi:MAG: arylesterase [Verrucomicrobia bacterium]|nr:arylesterase [Verrucomicrobiota bacterium]
MNVAPLRFLLRLLFLISVSSVCSVGLLRAETPAPRTIVFFGDSLTAGYGLDDPDEDAYPALIRKKIVAENLPWRVVNAGLSGETTAGGRRRVDWILRQPVDVFVLALGGNDGLRGIEPAVSQENLQAIIASVRAKYPAAKILLAGMQMPPSMGEDYAHAFAAMYPALADKNQLPLVPFLLEGVGGHADLNQADGIHPTPAGHALVAETVWKKLRPLLQ